MWRRERCLVQVVGVEGDNGHVVSTGIGEDGHIRLRTQSCLIHPRSIEPLSSQGGEYLEWLILSSRNVRGRAIMLFLPHHLILQRIGITLDILNLLLAQLLDCHQLLRSQLIFMADLST